MDNVGGARQDFSIVSGFYIRDSVFIIKFAVDAHDLLLIHQHGQSTIDNFCHAYRYVRV
jgi:hypothetical protein